MKPTKIRHQSKLITTAEQEAELNKTNPLTGRMFSGTVAKVVYDETGDLLRQLQKLCGRNPFVLMHDHAGYYVQVQQWKDENSASGILKSSWQPITGISYDQRTVLQEAIDRLMKGLALTPPETLSAPMQTGVAAVDNAAVQNRLEEALQASEALLQDQTEEEETEPEDNEDEEQLLRPEPEDLLGEQVSAEKVSSKGSSTNIVAGTLVMKSYNAETGEQYGVEYRDAGGHKRSVAVKPETIVLVPSKEELQSKRTPIKPQVVVAPGTGSVGVAASIVAEL